VRLPTARRLRQKQHRTVLPSVIEELTQVLFGFPNPFANYCSQIDSIQVRLQFVGERLGGPRLAGATFAREKRGDAIATGACRDPRSISMAPQASRVASRRLPA